MLSRPTGHARGRRPDDGAVAVLAAIMISGVLLTVGALTIDLGTAWAERVGLQGVADAAALAGAAVLPQVGAVAAAVEDDARVAAVRVLCTDANRRPDWDASAICPSVGVPGWADDGNLGNGEVSVTLSDEYPGLDADLTPLVLQVITPPILVEFGLARAAGFDSATFSSVAGARRGLPYPADTPIEAAPFYLTLEDLRHPNGDAVCLRVTPRPTNSNWGPAPEPTPDPASPDPANPDPWFRLGDPDDRDIGGQAPETVILRDATFGPVTGAVGPADVTVYLGAADAAHRATTDAVTLDPSAGTYQIEFSTPDFTATPVYGPDVPIWFVYDDGTVNGVSSSDTLTYPDPPGAPVNDCDSVEAGRGLVDLTREDGGRGPGAATAADVRDGLDTTVLPFGGWPRPQPLPDADQDCYDPAVDGVAVPGTPPGGFVDDANCVPLKPGAQVSPVDLTTGLLGTTGTDGRLNRLCTSDAGSISGRPGVFDTSRLFRRANGLVSPSVDTVALRSRLRDGRAADGAFRNTITPKVFECPRLLLVPVVDTEPLPADPAGHFAVVGLTYVWISDVRDYGRPRPLRGVITDDAGAVVGVRGWVVDPGYVHGGDWVEHAEADPDDALPLSVLKSAVLVRSPDDDHPDNGP